MEKRLPKSPLLPPKSPVLYESYKSGCARNLIHFFGFRQNPSKKMISSKKHTKKQTTDKEKKRKKLINLLTDDEKPQESDVSLQSEPEIVCDSVKKHQSSGKNSKKSRSVPSQGCNETSIRGKRQSFDLPSKQSKDFVDALEVLNSNKELFVNLLQDPNSVLVKHIQELKDEKQESQSQQPPDTIVVLKPGTHRPAFVEGMTRKLRQTMKISRKEQNKTSLDGELQRYLCDFQISEGSKEVGGKAVSTSGRDSRSSSATQFSGNVSDVCSSPRKHVSEMLNGRKDAFFGEETVRNMDGMSFFSEYDSFVRDWAYGYYSAQMRYSPYANCPTFYGDKWKDLREKNRKKVYSPPQADEQPQIFNASSSSRDCLKRRGKDRRKEAPFIPDNSEEDLYLDSQKPDSSGNCEYPSLPLVQKTEECEPGTSSDQTTSSYQDNKHRPLSDYIQSILLVSCPDWDKLSAKCSSSDKILDTTETCPDMLFDDPRLILNYINEVLLELHQFYSRSYPWIPLLSSRPKPVLSKNMVHEVLKHVDWQILAQRPQETLQQLVEKDLMRSGTWIDVGNDDEDVVAEIVDSLLRDLIVEEAADLY